MTVVSYEQFLAHKHGGGDTLEAMYLDYINNFLSVAGFAEHYGISEREALAIIRPEERPTFTDLFSFGGF